MRKYLKRTNFYEGRRNVEKHILKNMKCINLSKKFLNNRKPLIIEKSRNSKLALNPNLMKIS